MRPTFELLRREPQMRLFMAAHLQSSLGTGAGYVALVLIAYERFRSPWAISLVLLADFLPAMLAGPLFGAAADRWSRRRCAVVADVARAAAFIGIGLVGGIEATVALALLAGAGSGLFTPAVLAGLPSLVEEERLPAATSLYGAISDLGHTLGPALAAVVLLVAGPETLLIANGATFAVSALLVARLSFGGAAGEGSGASIFVEAGRGLRATAGTRGVREVILASSAVVLFAGMMNIGELLLAEDLGAGASGFSVLVAVYGAGFVAGSLTGSSGGSAPKLKRRYLLGLLLMGVGLVGAALAPAWPLAVACFAITGAGNGLVLVHERLLLQRTVDQALMGRVFAASDALGSWAFAIAFLSAGALVALLGTRAVFLLAGVGTLLVWAASARALRHVWQEPGTLEVAGTRPVAPFSAGPAVPLRGGGER